MMRTPYARAGRTLLVQLANGDTDTVGAITGPEPDRTVDLLNRAARENDRRHYTASARLYARAEPDVTWYEPCPNCGELGADPCDRCARYGAHGGPCRHAAGGEDDRMTLHLTHTGPYAGTPYCGAPRNDADTYQHAAYDRAQYAGQLAGADTCAECAHVAECRADDCARCTPAELA